MIGIVNPVLLNCLGAEFTDFSESVPAIICVYYKYK